MKVDDYVETSTFPVWDVNGNVLAHVHSKLDPSYSEWISPEELDTIPQDILKAASYLVGENVAKVARKGDKVMEVLFEDGQHFFLRRPHEDEPAFGWTEVFDDDVNITKWIKSQCLRTPVPAVCYTDTVWSRWEYRNFSLVEALPGCNVGDNWHRLELPYKENIVRSYVDFLIELASLEVPQTHIGTTHFYSSEPDLFRVVPMMRLLPFQRAKKTFRTIEEYLTAIIAQFAEEEHIGGPYDNESERVLEKLRQKVLRHCRNIAYSSPARRLMLSHDDLRPLNVLISETELTGIIDWEYHSIYPAGLTIDYPQWIRNTGYHDPRFCYSRAIWFDPPEMCKHLRDVFDEHLRKEAPKLWIAFEQGRILRDVVSWMICDPHPDEGCARLEAWMDATTF